MTKPREPTVTIAIPALDEQRNIGRTLEAIGTQTYGSIVEVVVADGGSRDCTREIVASVPNARVIDNPGRCQAAGLNRIIALARGSVIVRVDAHCEIPPGYVQACVDALLESNAAMVGGRMVPEGNGATSRAVAAALASKCGAGVARFHGDGPAGWVDTVYLGAFSTALARDVGGYDEALSTNEDAEFAIRMARRGGVWFEPRIWARYRPRATVRAVAEQFYRYGRGRAETLRRHPTTIRVRQLAAPGLVLGLLSPWRRQIAVGYLGVLAVSTIQARRAGLDAVVRVPAVLTTMHLSWGAGLLVGIAGATNPPRTKHDLASSSEDVR